MPTVAQTFYQSTGVDDQAFSGEATVRKLLESAGTGTGTMTWSATAAQTRTAIPGAGSTVNSNTSQNNGWAINNGGADGMGATSSVYRRIAEGVWDFSAAMSVNTPALLASIPSSTITAYVYRVPSGGGARVLLFSAVSAGFTATGTVTWSSASQPAIELTAGQTIMVGFTMSSGATAALVLGSITNTVWTMTYGANTWVGVPAPGIRSLFFQNNTGTNSPGVGARITTVFALYDSNVAAASGVIRKTIRIFDSAVMPGAGQVFKQPWRHFVSSIGSAALLLKRPVLTPTGTVTPGPSALRFFVATFMGGSAASSSTLTRRPGRILSGAHTPGPGSVTRFSSTHYEGTVTPSATVFKRLTRILTGTQTPGPNARITHVVRHVTGVVTSSSVMSRGLFRFYTGAVTSTSEVLKRSSTHYASTATPSAEVFKRATRILTSTNTPGPGQVIRMPVRRLASTITPAAQRVYFVVKKFPISVLGSAGQVTKRYMPQPYASSITPGPGTLTRRAGKLLSSAIASSSTVQGLLRKNVQGTITPTGDTTKRPFLFFTSALNATGAVAKRMNRFFSGLLGPTEDYAVISPTRQVAGIVRDQGGTPFEGATVKLFRAADDAFIAATTSASDGSYSFARDQNDPNVYFVVAYEEVGENTQGLTVRGLIPESV